MFSSKRIFVTFLLLKLEESGWTTSIALLLKPWLLTSSGHQQPCHWLCMINVPLFSAAPWRGRISTTCVMSVSGNDSNCKYIFMFSKNKFSTTQVQRLTLSSAGSLPFWSRERWFKPQCNDLPCKKFINTSHYQISVRNRRHFIKFHWVRRWAPAFMGIVNGCSVIVNIPHRRHRDERKLHRCKHPM